MPTEIIYDEAARISFMRGINKVANAVSVTYGSAGPAVMIEHIASGLPPIFTRDGITVAKAIQCDDRTEDLGARMLRDAASTVSRNVGDGTSSTIILAQAISNECMIHVNTGYHPIQLKRGMDLALSFIEAKLKERAITGINEDLIKKISAIATKNEAGVGTLLVEAFDQLGTDCPLTFQLGNSRDDKLSIVDGLSYEQGYLSPTFVTDTVRDEAILENPYILLCDKEISDLMDLVPILEEVSVENRPLLIIAEDVTDKALSGLLLNHSKGIFNVAVVKPPGFGDKRENRLNDLALMTGGEALVGEFTSKIEHASLEQLGQAKRVIISSESITIAGGYGDPVAIKQRMIQLKKEAEIIQQKKPGDGSITGNKHDFEELEERLAILSGKTGIYEVGGYSDIEIKERMVRIENAYMSTKAAIEEGIIAGGGVGLFNIIPLVDELTAPNPDQQQGIHIVKKALAYPLHKLVSNVNDNSETVISRLCAENNPHFAYNTQDKIYGDFIEIGVIDAVKVIRLALRNAVSTVGTLLSTHVVIKHIPDLSIMAGYSPEWAAATREDPRAP